MAVISCRQQRIIYSLLLISILENVHAAGPQEFPLPPYVDAICIPVEIDGKEHLFMLDSGASRNVIDESLQKHLGSSVGDKFLLDAEGQRIKFEFFASPRMRIGKTEWTCSEVIGCFDFSLIQEATGRNIEGILGIPFFDEHIIQLDFDRGQLRILPPDTPPEEDWGTKIKIKFEEKDLPRLPLTLPEVGLEWCVIDTGFNGSLSLNWATCLELEKNAVYSPQPDRLMTVASGQRWTRNGIISRVNLQEFEHSHLMADCSKKNSSVGLHYLNRFRVTIDIRQKLVYFAKGTKFDHPDLRPIGFRATRKGEKILLTGVQSGLPGESAGIRSGDELVSMEGVSARDMSTNEVEWKIRQLSKDGTKTVRLKTVREGEVHDLQLDLSEIYD